MAEVERGWFRLRLGGQQLDRLYITGEQSDADIECGTPATAESDYAAFAAELDETFVHPRSNSPMSLRWVYVHMIEEYARHCGHADLIRERIDGATGS